jgi:eukaryotic-like serine/threonine-protein kinase
MERSLKRARLVKNLQVVDTLGVGGIATVYLARCSEGGRVRNVALKKLHPELRSDPSVVAGLLEEASIGRCIRHPNVVGVIGLYPGIDEEPPGLMMDWVDGANLWKVARCAGHAGRRLPLDVIAAIIGDVLSGLHATHEWDAGGHALDIVHRDVSPRNILVGRDGVSRIADFGAAQAAWQRRTEREPVKGSLGYMAPEQLWGPVDRRSDLYSVGVVLWELLTGARMRATPGPGILTQILYGEVDAPSKYADAARCLDEVVALALADSPDGRFATAAEMREALVSSVAPAGAARVADVVRELLDESRGVAKAPNERMTETAPPSTLRGATSS